MKGIPLIAHVLASIKTKPKTVTQLAAEFGLGYVSMMRLVGEFRDSGLIQNCGRTRPKAGAGAVIYGFRGGEARAIKGREQTVRFLAAWNAMLEPESAEEVSAEIGVLPNCARKIIRAMRRAGIVRIAAWQRNPVSIPTRLYAVTPGRDATRPKAYTWQEYNRRAAERRQARELHQALSWRLAA